MTYGKIISIKKGFVNNDPDRETIPAIILDTNILLYLVNRDEYFEFLLKLDTLISNNQLLLILPQQVLDEFHNNIETVVKRKEDNIKRIINEAGTLKDHFVPLAQDKGEEFSKLLNLLEANEDKIFRRNLYRKVSCLELLFKLKAVIVESTENVKVEAVNMALEKRAPFFGDRGNNDNKDVSKLSMGDAVIFLSTIEFLKENKFKKVFFITENPKDFCEAGKKHELHSNIKHLAEEVSLRYSINIAAVINEVISEIDTPYKTIPMKPIAKEVVNRVEEEVTSDCPFCNNPYAIIVGGWKQGLEGLSWFNTCMNCKNTWDTGDLFDL